MNTNAKHTQSKATPGQWVAYNATGNAGRILKRWIVEAPTKKICTVDDQPADATAATAALIAAAPDLLFALYACLAELVDVVNAEGGDESEAMKQARAAIAQAEGGAQ